MTSTVTTSKIAFGGMWVFPGDRVDPQDYPSDGDADAAAPGERHRLVMSKGGFIFENTLEVF